MTRYTQAGRPLAIATPLGPDALLLDRFRGSEAISKLFSFQLDLLAESPVPFDRLLGQAVTVRLSLHGHRERFFHGIIKRLGQGQRVRAADTERTFLRYHADMVPRFWLWTKRAQTRSFQQQSVPDILRTVLHGLDVSIDLRGTYHAREYCVQYRESDFAFASRLMEEEGIFYFFRHTAAGHAMIVSDTPLSHPDVEPNAVIYDPVQGGQPHDSRITAWQKNQEVCTGKQVLWDHCFELPGQNLEVDESIPERVAVGEVSHVLRLGSSADLEVYDYPGGYAHHFDGIGKGGTAQPAELTHIFDDNRRSVRIRMEQEVAESLSIEGQGACAAFAVGHKFQLNRHFDGDGPYLLTRVEHDASIVGVYTALEEVVPSYQNQFCCLPLSVPYRPSRVTAKPRIMGTQTATVVGPDGEEIFCDRYGRVKVQFHWDRQGRKNTDSSCWMRVGQSWAGKNFGAMHIPRVGQEVIVAFLEGDPDRPIIVGSVYNAEQMPPFTLPDNRTQSGLKTHSRHGQNENFSGLAFEDDAGAEHVHLHSEKYLTQQCEDTLYVNAANQHHVNVGNAHSFQVGGIPGVNHALTNAAGDDSGGSGGGGGGDAASWGAAGWTADVGGGLGQTLTLVAGWNHVVTGGLVSQFTLGQNNISAINPLGLLDLLGIQVSNTFLQSAMSTLESANVGVTIGTSTNLHYGKLINVHCGPTIEINHAFTALSATTLAAAAYTASVLADTILDFASPQQRTSWVDITLGAGATELLLAAWVTAEVYAQNTFIVTQVAAAASSASVVFGQQEDPECADVVSLLTTLSGVTTAQQATEMKVSATQYSIVCPDIALLSAASATATSPAVILLQAVGNNGQSGLLRLSATENTHIAGGSQTYLRLQTDAASQVGTVTLASGAQGTLQLTAGNVDNPNYIILDQNQVSISIGQNSLVIDANGITLTAAAGNAIIKMDNSGISLKCGGNNVVKVGTAGLTLQATNVSISADSSYQVNAPAQQHQ